MQTIFQVYPEKNSQTSPKNTRSRAFLIIVALSNFATETKEDSGIYVLLESLKWFRVAIP